VEVRAQGLTNPFLGVKTRPLVVGHRGVPHLHQENTLAGFRRAIELGVPAIELDVRLTSDHQVVVLHDHNLRRLTGSAVDSDRLSWDQLSRLRIRRELPMGIDTRGAQVVVRYDREERIPLLAEVLAEVGSKLAINIEIKFDLPRWWGLEIVPRVAQVIADAHATDRVIVTSFDVRKLSALGRLRPGLARGFCFDDTMLDFARPVIERLPALAPTLPTSHGPIAPPRRYLTRLLESHLVGRVLGTRLVGAEHTLIGERTVQRLHGCGVAIGTHTLFPIGSTNDKPLSPTADTDEEARRLVGLGVDWIESDDPARLLPLVG